ncbi:MAG: MBL fold metallo-hydrolase [Candidatus Jacksonbacteria bacterium]
MYIYWLGESSFKIKTDQANLIIDPAAKDTGLNQSLLPADIVLVSHALSTDLKRIKPPEGASLFIIQNPGEYETRGIFVYGLSGNQNNVLYLIKADNLTIAHLAGLNQDLNSEEIELFEGADIALMPVGDCGVLSGKRADQVISQIEPKIVIPMNYQLPKLNIKREPIDSFILEMGAEGLQPETSLSITKAKLPIEETRIVLLQA